MYINLALAEVGPVMWSHELEHRDTPRSDSLPKVTESVEGGGGARGEVEGLSLRSQELFGKALSHHTEKSDG